MIPIAIEMAIEVLYGKNYFSFLGGVSEISIVREGRVRAQGPFLHPILAGTLGATMFPLFFSKIDDLKKYKSLLIGIFVSISIVYLSASSGPVLSIMSGIISLCLWKVRRHIKVVNLVIAISLIFLNFYMNAPIWYIIDRISSIMGGRGWDRSELINSFIKYFDEWWLFGTSYTRHWKPNALPINPNMADITNNFIRIGVDGGLITLILFLVFLVNLFKRLEKKIRTLKDNEDGFFYWSLGCALLTHVVSFISVSYFDQINVFLYILIAMIIGTTQIERK
jgi:O-antigen ligase